MTLEPDEWTQDMVVEFLKIMARIEVHLKQIAKELHERNRDAYRAEQRATQ